MIKEKLAIDIDDVLAETTEAMRLLVNRRRGINLTRANYSIEADYWGYYEAVWAHHNIDDNGLMEEFHGGLAVDQSEVEPTPGAVEAVDELKKYYDLIAVTSRPEEMAAATNRWLDINFKDCFSSRVFLGFEDHAKQTKGEVCSERDVSWLIDDNVEHCTAAIAKGVGAVLFGDFGWHRQVPNELIVCRDWPAVVQFFNEQRR